jgi:fatty-acyl-CoA synthase
MGTPPGLQTGREASIVRGIPLVEEPGLGALTVPGYLSEVTSRFGEREALVWRTRDTILRWSYATLWERAVEVARALIACGVAKDARVGILMTNRPAMLAAAFGTALAGGVAVLLNTFSTPSELGHLVAASDISILLFERHIASRDFTAVLAELEPATRAAEPGRLLSTRFPFLRRLAVLDEADGAARGSHRSLVRLPAARQRDASSPRRGHLRVGEADGFRGALLLLRDHQPAQGRPPRPEGGGHPVVALGTPDGDA